MKQIASAADIAQLGSIMSIWAHPDDETFCCAALMAAAASNGQEVSCVTATKGEAGVRDTSRWPKERLGDIRVHEVEKALQILGVKKHHWLGYGDGACNQVDFDEAVTQLATLIMQQKPDTILTFGSDGMTGHPDHTTVSRWVEAATRRVEKRPQVYHAVELRENYENYLKQADEKLDIYFNIDQPPLSQPNECDIYYCLTREEQLQKRAALAAMPSQMETLLEYFDEQLFCEVFRCECFVKV